MHFQRRRSKDLTSRDSSDSEIGKRNTLPTKLFAPRYFALCYRPSMLASALALVMMALPLFAGGRTDLKPEGKTVVLNGRIRLVHGYGPPGWGENPKHDEKITYWVIDLPTAINTPCEPERPEWAPDDCQSTKQLRLMIETDDQLLTEAKATKGRRAVVTGILHRADTAGEITPIYVDVTKISPSP